MQTQRQLLRLSAASFLFPSLPPPPSSHRLYFSGRPSNRYSLCSAHKAWLAQLSEELTAMPPTEGHIDFPSFIRSLISASEDLSSLQTAASFLITGAFSLYLLRTVRRSARRAKERKLRSSALESLRNVELKMEGMKKKKRNPPSPYETLFGALIGAAFGFLLYNFTISVEHTLNNQPLSPNYSVRQITITIRTIINGLCYLATFVFGFNSLGLFLYTGQLAMNSYVDVRASRDKVRSDSLYPKIEDSSNDQNSDSQVKK